jgi:hypothetical protein
MAASAVRTGQVTFDEGSVFSFKDGQAGIEQAALGNDDDVETRRDLVPTENLSNQSLRAISLNGSTELPGGRYPEPRSSRGRLGEHEHGGEAAVHAGAAVVNLLKVGSPTDVFETAESLAPARRRRAQVRPRYSELTVRRFRPFARRRLSTSRPFFVLIRTRKPWARARRRVFGWNVLFPFIFYS